MEIEVAEARSIAGCNTGAAPSFWGRHGVGLDWLTLPVDLASGTIPQPLVL